MLNAKLQEQLDEMTSKVNDLTVENGTLTTKVGQLEAMSKRAYALLRKMKMAWGGEMSDELRRELETVCVCPRGMHPSPPVPTNLRPPS